MKFKTSAEIKAEKEAAGKSSQHDEKLKAKLAERANRKYAKMAEESAKREAEAKKKRAEAGPTLVVDRSNVIVAPALLSEVPKPTKGLAFTKALKKAVDKANDDAIKKAIEAESQFYGGRPVPKAESKQVWDEATKQWVKKS